MCICCTVQDIHSIRGFNASASLKPGNNRGLAGRYTPGIRGFNASASLKPEMLATGQRGGVRIRGFNASASLKLGLEVSAHLRLGRVSEALMPRPH